MSILIVLLCIVLLVVLISRFKFNAFLAFLIVSIIAGLLLGIDSAKITGSLQKGIGSMFGDLVIVIICGAMLGKLVAESGAAQKIATGMMQLFGVRYISWALMVTGFIIGIPLYYNVGFLLVVPLIFAVAYRYNLPPLVIGLPMLTSLSVTHGFLPPHPSPTALVAQFHADMGKTLIYGLMISIPTVIIAGPFFAKTLRRINVVVPTTFQANNLPDDKLPSLANSIITSLLPVILLAVTTILLMIFPVEGPFRKTLAILNDPSIVMLLSLIIAVFTLGLNTGMDMKKIMDVCGDSVKEIALLLLVISGAGALKQVLIDSGVSLEIAAMFNKLDVHPLVLGWLIACVIRVCLGSATVAGITAAGIVAPLLNQPGVDASLMVLSVGAGSLMFSHVNDSGFWLFKEYFNLSIKDTIKSWSMMETIVAICGLIGVLILNAFV